MGKRLLTSGTASAVPDKPARLTALAAEVRFSSYVQAATRTALAESGNLFDSQDCTWGTFGNILCCVTCHQPTVLPHPQNQKV
jgi:hypothetical protein